MYNTIYYFSKTTGRRTYLGEIQNDYNMSFVVDGTKDSCKVEVLSKSVNREIEPWTVIYHSVSETFWVVSKDEVEYLMNDPQNDYIYRHNIQLLGLVELLNARDLTDCGFNANTYTVGEFINRLFSLSSFEYGIQIETNNLNLDEKVDYTKTFENYTLLSALREFLDGYNCAVKATFTITQPLSRLGDLVLHIISKSGNGEEVFEEDIFTNVEQSRTIGKESFGTTVVSNAENVISTKDKTYPALGSIKASADSLTITRDNALSINNVIAIPPSNINGALTPILCIIPTKF